MGMMGRDQKVRKEKTYLKSGEAHDTPEIVEDGDLRYRRRVETRDALARLGDPLIIRSRYASADAKERRSKTGG